MSTENIKMQIKKRKRVGRKGKEWESLLMAAPHRGLTKHHITLISMFVNNCLRWIHIILQTMRQQWRALKHYSTLWMQLEIKKNTRSAKFVVMINEYFCNCQCDVKATVLTTSHNLTCVCEDAVVCGKKADISVTWIAVEHSGGWRPSNNFFSTIK